MTTITIGKVRRLQQCATPGGKLVIFALDHRGNLQRALSPNDPQSVTYEQMVSFKLEVTAAMSPVSSGILLDPQYGAAQSIAAGVLDNGCGLLVALEKTGYTGEPTARQSQILPGWRVEKICRMGADRSAVYVSGQGPVDQDGKLVPGPFAEQARLTSFTTNRPLSTLPIVGCSNLVQVFLADEKSSLLLPPVTGLSLSRSEYAMALAIVPTLTAHKKPH